MAVTLQQIVLLTVGVAVIHSAKLPAYIKPCSRSDPNLNECARKNGQEALATLVKGDRAYHIPNLNPLQIPEVKIQSGDNLKIDLKNAVLSGLENAVLKDFNIDRQNHKLSLTLDIDRVNVLADYVIDGRILVLPITGEGPLNITAIGGHYTYLTDYDLIDKEGKQYVQFKNNDLKADIEKIYFHLDNLFGGDKRLGDEMNKFLNDNSKEVEKDLGPSVTQAISQIAAVTLNGIFSRVPYDDIFV